MTTEKRILLVYAGADVRRRSPCRTVRAARGGYYVSTFLEEDGKYVEDSEMPVGCSTVLETALDMAVMETKEGWAGMGTAPEQYDEVRFEGLEIKPVRAECHTDDYAFEYEFDAALWFKQAGAKQIIALGNCGWGGDYPADDVAQWMAKYDDRLALLFSYLEIANKGNQTVGFECHVDDGDAAQWLTTNRPALLAEIESAA